jgi:betaine-aldehyde dehydrogenase
MFTRDELFIGGAWVKPASEDRIEVISPSSEELVGTVPAGAAADMDAAVAAARRAFDDGPWPRMAPEERAGRLVKIAEHLAGRSEELAVLLTTENGTPIKMSQGMAMGPVAILHSVAKLASTYPFSERCDGLAASVQLLREPVGVVAAIAPWNGPLYLSVSKLAPALLAGCPVIVKPAPETPLDAYVLAEACEAADLPEGVVSIVAAGREVGQHLVANAGVDKVAFTGSTAAGRKIMATCAERIARVTLELGGKSAAIVLADVELDAMAEQLLRATTMLSGQACALLSRILVPRERHDEIVDALCTKIQTLTMGDPFDLATDLGPLVAQRQRDRVEKYLALAQEEGARIAMGGGRPPHLPRGWYVEPTVLTNVDNGMRIAREEIFGPVVAVIPYDDVDEAVRIANDSDYGLHGAVFTSDVAAGYEIGRRVRTGSFTVNGFCLDPGIPFGGFKQSGVGREGGSFGVDNYVEIKAMSFPEGFTPSS